MVRLFTVDHNLIYYTIKRNNSQALCQIRTNKADWKIRLHKEDIVSLV